MKNYLLVLAILLGLVEFAPALAQINAGIDANVNANTNGTSINASTTVRLGAGETRAKERGAQEIERRVSALTRLSARINAMQRVTDEFRQALSTNVQTQVQALTALNIKIQADTDVATLRADIKSVTQSYRIFALVMPQANIAAAADRIVTTVSMLNALGLKLQARVQAAAQTGADVGVLTAALTDMSTQLTEAQNKAQAAVSASTALQPDNGDAAKMKANTEALKGARADIVAAHQALIKARKDVDTIVRGLKSLQTNVNASSSTQVQTQ